MKAQKAVGLGALGLFLGVLWFNRPRSRLAPPQAGALVLPREELARITFAYDSAHLAVDSRVVLDQVAAAVLSASRPIVIAGHTDNVGSATYNAGLSEERAMAVEQALYQRSVPAELMTWIGLGATQPIASNDTEAGRAQNRRVEIRWA